MLRNTVFSPKLGVCQLYYYVITSIFQSLSFLIMSYLPSLGYPGVRGTAFGSHPAVELRVQGLAAPSTVHRCISSHGSQLAAAGIIFHCGGGKLFDWWCVKGNASVMLELLVIYSCRESFHLQQQTERVIVFYSPFLRTELSGSSVPLKPSLNSTVKNAAAHFHFLVSLEMYVRLRLTDSESEAKKQTFISNPVCASAVFRCSVHTLLSHQDTICVLLALEEQGRDWHDEGWLYGWRVNMVVKERMEW